MKWDDSYKVGVEEIDRQHHKLFDLLNELSQAVDSGHGEEIVGPILVGMSAYADKHFKAEQVYLEKHPDYQAHFQEHWDFTRKCMKLVMGFRQGQAVSQETLLFLMDWLTSHILQKDRLYFRELAREGLLP